MSHAFRAIFNKFYSFFKRITLLSSKIKIVMNFKTSIQVAKTELANNMKKNHKIYFIDKGIVNIYKNGNQIFSLTDGYFFGIESLLLDENKDDKISYKVSDECSYAILYTIDISYLIKEVLNYDSESFISLINLADFYIDNIIKEQNTNLFIKERQESLDEMAKITNPKNSVLSIKSDSLNNDINMINNYSEITGNIEDFIIENMIPKRKINCDLLQPGYLPELDAKLAEYQRANNVIDESNLKIDLVNKQINFVNKYIGRLLDE
jgi:signal-transduction protein with cAMP-binding, CBS, and nucleotidyltransferase domain